MLNTESAVRERYSAAAGQREAELCCPVDYDAKYLKVIPDEVIERDYGCGDPSKHVRAGETVLDLGSGGGKICFIASQVVGAQGKVIGVDMNDTMLDLARRSKTVVAEKVGFDNVDFRKGKIQDMAIDRDAVDQYLAEHPVTDESGLQKLEAFIEEMRQSRPMIADESIDVVVSNCVLNLVAPAEKEQLFREIFRVLKVGGRAVISDIVSDELVPIEMQHDADLWSGCISGAFHEHEFLEAFTRAGFQGVTLETLQESPWQTVEGIEFRSATVIAYKPADVECFEHNEAVMYRGPYAKVVDDSGHTFQRGQRTAVCRKTFQLMTGQAYGKDFVGIEPRVEISESEAKPFECTHGEALRSPKVTKGKNFKLTIASEDCCGDEGCC
ncbi:arsenite S-adenosylmethyltransferase [Rubripirellula obstinata]|uniref:Arsenite methyltransferase n=1 Tax=Rubripirellula obstinata TaxID=406547 RepID=A0A5B1CIX9_9BACT|nr:methyltransferase domain-containing protein [Rubripirellula obstinata]KAA1260556.1 arsenite S-adenosylmethyltransferase [Rubripirellula obstinata]